MEQAILRYVENGIDAEKKAILQFPTDKLWKTVEQPFTVYRGQKRTYMDPSKMALFSTSKDRQQAQEEFAGSDGCLWVITLQQGVRYIDIEEFLKERKHKKAEERELLVVGGGVMDFTQTSKTPCAYTASYTPVSKPTVTYDELYKRYISEMEELGMDDTTRPSDTILKEYLKTGEIVGGKRRFKMPRKMTRKYCKKTPCKKMGFTQRASCRPWKNCYKNKK